MQSRDEPSRSTGGGGTYHAKHDQHECVALWDLRGTAMSDAEWTQHFRDMSTIATWTAQRGARPAVMLLVPDRWVSPSAEQRATLAQASGAATYDPFLAIVTNNPIARGVLRVLNWLTEHPHYEAEVFSDVQTALAWLEDKRNAKLPTLRKWVHDRR